MIRRTIAQDEYVTRKGRLKPDMFWQENKVNPDPEDIGIIGGGGNMFPIFLTTSLLLVAGSSVYMSVYGLMRVFVDQAIVILCMGLGMEIGKILVVSHTYRSWQQLSRLSRALYILIVFILVLLTSIEVMGFLSQSHSYASHDLRIAKATLEALDREETVIRNQISVIDKTLEGLPGSYVTRRINERKKSGYPEKQARLLEIVQKKAEVEVKIIEEQQSSGPIFAVARIMDINDKDAVAALILLLILVLEPLSIGLTVATSAAWMARKSPQKELPEIIRSTHSNKELVELTKKHKLTISQIVRITGRKKPKTCEEWLRGKAPVPARALRAIRAWANRQDHEPTLDNDLKRHPKEKVDNKRRLSVIQTEQK